MSKEEIIARTPANENPWYWLATVYGEQEEGKAWALFDHDLAAKNRIAWNRWIAPLLSEARKAELIAKDFDAAELTPFDKAERQQFLRDFALRAGDPSAAPPDPGAEISFERGEFGRPISFDGFVFAIDADFRAALFSGDVGYRKAAFSGSARFREAVFLSWAVFHGATFCGGGYFGGARFSSIASFDEAEFSDAAAFHGTAFAGIASFERAKFSCPISFIGAKFESQTFFAGAKFLGDVPDFRDAKLMEATEWHGVTWPSAPKNKDAAQQQVYAYEKLKAEMERLKKHADEQMFFAKELRARRALAQSLSLKWPFYFAYEQFGGYGQSIARPLVWLALFWLAGAGLFALLPAADGWPLDYEDAARLSLVNLVPFLPYKPAEVVMKHLDDWVEWFGIFQAIIGAVLLFLVSPCEISSV